MNIRDLFKKNLTDPKLLNDSVDQCFPAVPGHCTFWMSPLSDQYISGPGVSSNELMRVCSIRKSWKMCSVGVPPGTGLGNTTVNEKSLYNIFVQQKACLLICCCHRYPF